jgi:alkyl hydroperoxide reductase subunit AhpC
MVKAYGLFNENTGAPRRAVIIVDKQGVVRFRQEYAPGTQPNPADILAELDKIK